MKIIRILVVAAMMTGGLHLRAQNVSAEYTTELQTDFRDFNLVNLLRLDADIPLCKSLTIKAATISIAKTREERLIDDLQIFSNIEEDNLPLALAVCGAMWEIDDRHTLFMGIRNMNEDYFTSDVTSFFTNSSCGAAPTISANFPIANYPLASVGLHYCYAKEFVKIQASLLNGMGYNSFAGHDNVFRFCPKDDGLFGIAQIEYQLNGNGYYIGICGHVAEITNHSNSSLGSAFWAYTEQKLSDCIGLIINYSHAFSAPECTDFVGIGGKYTFDRCELGIFADMARFEKVTEWATEITALFNINQHLALQPSIHTILTGSILRTVGTLRLKFSL